MHVVDINHPNSYAQAASVHQTLDEIGAGHIPVLTVLNKIDQLADPHEAQNKISNFPNAMAVSALQGIGIEELSVSIADRLYEMFTDITVKLPYHEGALISLFHEFGQVERVEHIRGGVFIQGKVPGRLLARFQPYFDRKEDQPVGN